MSRFFASGYSESETESSSEESVEIQTKTTGSRFRDLESESSSEDEGKRVVRSNKDKRFDEIQGIIQTIKNAMKINDWVAIAGDFERLTKAVQKAQSVIQKEGTPKIFIRFLIQLEDYMKYCLENKEAKAKMSSTNAKSLNTMKQRLKKHNKAYEMEIEETRKNPLLMDEQFDEAEPDEEEEEEEEEEDQLVPQNKASKAAPMPVPDNMDSDDPDFWATESESEDESEEEVEGLTGIEKWRKRTVDKDEEKEKQREKDREKAKEKETKRRTRKLSETDDKAFDVSKEVKTFTITPENVEKRLKEINESRGKKNTDRVDIMATLRKLLEVAKGNAGQTVKVLLTLIPTQFDYNPTVITYLPIDIWKCISLDILMLLETLKTHPEIAVHERVDVLVETLAEATAEMKVISSTIVSFVERLDDEFYKSLQTIDPHTTDYIDRLRDETDLYKLIVRAQNFFQQLNHQECVWRVIMRRIEHMYYKQDEVLQKVHQLLGDVESETDKEDLFTVFEHLCHVLYKSMDDRIRTRTLLCHVYFTALHDRFYKARDILLMSHLQESIQYTDVPTQILFNRTMVQLGLCAFRCGLIKEAQGCLHDISFSGRVRDLLAQGVTMQRFQDKSAEQERMDKQKQLPFHMHINLELIEAVYMTSSMLLEIPIMAANAFDKNKIISKPYRRLLDYIDRQMFSGPPENTREHIVAASKSLADGDWRQCTQWINSIKIWSLLPNGEQVKEMLAKKIQEEGLRTFLFGYSNFYESMSLEHLGAMFELSHAAVHSIVSKMIINEELHASLDQRTGTILLENIEPTKLQYTALQLAGKAAELVEMNEKWLEIRANMTVAGQQQNRVRQMTGKPRILSMGQRRLGRQDMSGRQQQSQQQQQGNRFRGGSRGGYRGDRGGRGGGRPNR